MKKASKSKFQKLIAFIIATVMLVSLVTVAIPIGAAGATGYTEITPNTDFVHNGITYRFDVREGNTDSYARINDDGSIEFKYAYGDILWFPDVKMTDTSALHAELTSIAHDSDSSGMGNTFMGIVYGATEKADGSFEKGVAGILRTAGRARVTEISRENLTNKSGGDHGNGGGTKIYNPSSENFKDNANYACVKSINNDWAFNKTISFDVKRVENNVTFAMSSADGEFFSHTYNTDSHAYAGAVGFTSVWANNAGYKTFRFDKLTLTNCTVNGAAHESYTVIDKAAGPMDMLKSKVEFEDGYAYVELEFTVSEDLAATAKLVVKKNGVDVEKTSISDLTPVEGKYSKLVYFTYTDGQESDALTIYLENEGAAVNLTTTTIEIGKLYAQFLRNPPNASDSELDYIAYAEDFSESITLVPGENIVNGHKWIYVKNSTDGSAVIKNGKLYFIGSNYDMIIFDDVVLDKTAYRFEYQVTYLETPADDVWDNWDCWFGGLFHLAGADANGNRSAFISSITPDDVYMMKGSFDANGVFTQIDANSAHINFNVAPGGSLAYWNGRIANGLPGKVTTWFGRSDLNGGGFGMRGYSATGAHQVEANLPGGAAASPADSRVGSLGFVCGESRVSVIVDDLSIATKGKKIVVDGEDMQIAADGKVDISELEADDMRLIYANVDGSLKYAGDIVSPTRFTNISTLQIAINTNKAEADGQTGLKWVTQISKADYEKLTSDSNISKVEVGTVMVATANAKDGVNKTVATSDIAGTATLDGDNYIFEGVLPIAKDARDTSYSGVGYVKVTMKDGKEVVVYADYIARLHAYALSDLVETFVDDEPAPAPQEPAEENGCGSAVLGGGAILMIAVLGGACMVRKKKYE